jgi:hypothetical protein
MLRRPLLKVPALLTVPGCKMSLANQIKVWPEGGGIRVTCGLRSFAENDIKAELIPTVHSEFLSTLRSFSKGN